MCVCVCVGVLPETILFVCACVLLQYILVHAYMPISYNNVGSIATIIANAALHSYHPFSACVTANVYCGHTFNGCCAELHLFV